MSQKIIIKTNDIVNSSLWQLFPPINVNRIKDIPTDYPGIIGVPITFLDKIGRNDGSSGFIVLGLGSPKINGKTLYKRVFIRNLKPELPEKVDLIEMLEKTGVELVFEEW